MMDTEALARNNDSESRETPPAPAPATTLNELRGLPCPLPLRGLYRLTMLRGFLRYPRRALNYLKFKRASRTLTVDYLPIQLDVEPVSRCNFHCTMCQVSDWPKYKRAEDLKLEDFKALVDSQYGLVELKLQGLGEPLLGRDPFFEMIKYARSKHIWVRLTTNASLLHLNDNYKKLIDSGVNEVQISFDGTTKETFEGIRRGSVFEKVVENCKLINSYANGKSLLRTRMWSLIQQSNVAEFFDFIEIAREMGFKRLTYSLELLGWGIDDWVDANRSVSAKVRVTREMAEEAIRRGAKYGIEVTFWNGGERYSTESNSTLCGWPFQRAFISSDMRIVPCCIVSNPDVAELGSARNFADVWNSEPYREFRRAHLEGRIPKICESCYERKSPEKQSLTILPD